MDPHDLQIGYKLPVHKDGQCPRAEILDIRHTPSPLYYVHYLNHNKRLDEWVDVSRLKLDVYEDIEAPKKKKVITRLEPRRSEKSIKSIKKVGERRIGERRIGERRKIVEDMKSSDEKVCDNDETMLNMSENLSENLSENNTLIVDDRKTSDEKKLDEENADTTYKVKNIQKICFEGYMLDPWYFSPYPKKIVEQPVVYICTFCLFYFGHEDAFAMHREICKLRHPPGNEIYRKNSLSFFELDGHVQKNYCRNICLLSKLFLDHKTLYYDVDPFLFYVLCVEKEDGMHMVGYLSKEKDSAQGYNVACLLVLPHCQRMGYGRVLIDFSYLLSKREGLVASPEKPLSDLGLVSYRKYWKEIIFAYVSKVGEVSVAEISKATSIMEDDIVAVLSEEKCLRFYDGEMVIVMERYVDEKQGVDETCLEWEVPSFTSGQLRTL